MKYKLEIHFTDEERERLSMLYGSEVVEKYINDLHTTIQVSAQLLISGELPKIESGGLN